MESKIEILTKKLHKFQSKNNKEEEIKILIEIGQFHYKENNFEKANLIFKEILEKDKNIEGINYYLALIKLQFDKFDEAKKYLREELKINKDNKFAKNLLSKLEVESNFPIITLLLVFLNVLVFYFIYPQISLIELIKFSAINSNFDFFRLVSSLFFHVNLIHISINIIFLLMFGLILEKMIGSVRFLTIYLISGIFGNFTEIYFGVGNFVIGASSAIFGLVGATLLRKPLLEMRIFGIIKAPLILVFGSFFAISSFISNYVKIEDFANGNIAHLSGFLIGILIVGIMYKENIFVFYNWLFIAIGFWILSFAMQNLYLSFLTFEIILIQIVLILISLFLIIYSYAKLKKEIIMGVIE